MLAVKRKPIFRFSMLFRLIGLLPLIGLFFLPVNCLQAATIVLDPGHGGTDGGASDGSGFYEKQFTLALANRVAKRLAARHRVDLTRTSDVEMAPADRTAVPNHLRADLMISLHASVAPYCSNRTAAIFYHNDERLSLTTETFIQGELTELDVDRPAWARLQIQHQRQSQYLATALKKALVDSPTFESVAVGGIPLVALMGADLPAVVIEVGCVLTSAMPDAQALELQLDEYAESIAQAIEAALPGLTH